jgi:acyl-CoA thioester hydrolase
MTAVYECRHRVSPDETDGIGHVNHLVYLKWLQDVAIAHAAAQGWPPQRHLDMGSGWVVRSHAIEYLRPAFAGDELLIQTWVAGFKRISSLRKYQISRPSDRSLLVRAETNWAFVDYATHLPRRIPEEIVQSFEIVIAEKEPRRD